MTCVDALLPLAEGLNKAKAKTPWKRLYNLIVKNTEMAEATSLYTVHMYIVFSICIF